MPITTGAQARHLKGIGRSISARIDHWFGVVNHECSSLSSDDLTHVLQNLHASVAAAKAAATATAAASPTATATPGTPATVAPVAATPAAAAVTPVTSIAALPAAATTAPASAPVSALPSIDVGEVTFAVLVALHREQSLHGRAVSLDTLQGLARRYVLSSCAAEQLHKLSMQSRVVTHEKLVHIDKCELQHVFQCSLARRADGLADALARRCHLFEQALFEAQAPTVAQANLVADVTLLIDNNEPQRSLSDTLRWACKRPCVPLPCEQRTLVVGDFCWSVRATDGTERFAPLVVERKTWDDLEMSVHDGRLLAQVRRMLHYFGSGSDRRVLIVEGKPPTASPKPEVTRKLADAWGVATLPELLGLLVLKYDFRVCRTASVLDTIRLLQRMTVWVHAQPPEWREGGLTVASVTQLRPAQYAAMRPCANAVRRHDLPLAEWRACVRERHPLALSAARDAAPSGERQLLVVARDVTAEATEASKALRGALSPLLAEFLVGCGADEVAAERRLRASLATKPPAQLDVGRAVMDFELDLQLERNTILADPMVAAAVAPVANATPTAADARGFAPPAFVSGAKRPRDGETPARVASKQRVGPPSAALPPPALSPPHAAPSPPAMPSPPALPPAASVQWQVWLRGAFRPYPEDVSRVLEGSFARGESQAEVIVFGKPYVVRLGPGTMRQEAKHDYTRTREVRRAGGAC